MMNPALNAVIPVICVALAGLTCMLAEAFRDKGERMPIGGLALIGLAGAGISSVLLWGRRAESFGVVTADDFGLFVGLVLVGVGVLTVFLSAGIVERDGLPAGEFYALVLFALSGMMLMAIATDLLLIFLALEVFSLSIYVLTGLRRETFASTEGAFKYFLLGGFSSAFFLYGIAFTYGIVHSTRLARVAIALQGQGAAPDPLVLVAMTLLLVGFAFKVSAVPFHMWTPDAYEGAPSIVTGFMSTAVKAAAFATFVRVFLVALEPLHATWAPVLWVLAVCTMIVGTIVGVAQTSIKRMLAYSSIAHGGYLLVALLVGTADAKASILFYLLVYAITNLGAFGIIAILGSRDKPRDLIADYKGLWYSRPVAAFMLTVFLLSLGGFPPTVGFIAKWYVFTAAVGAGQSWLAIIGLLTSVVSVFFYLRVIVMMYMSGEAEGDAPPALSPTAVTALAVSVLALFYLGVLPTRVLTIAAAAIATIF